MSTTDPKTLLAPNLPDLKPVVKIFDPRAELALAKLAAKDVRSAVMNPNAIEHFETVNARLQDDLKEAANNAVFDGTVFFLFGCSHSVAVMWPLLGARSYESILTYAKAAMYQAVEWMKEQAATPERIKLPQYAKFDPFFEAAVEHSAFCYFVVQVPMLRRVLPEGWETSAETQGMLEVLKAGGALTVQAVVDCSSEE